MDAGIAAQTPDVASQVTWGHFEFEPCLYINSNFHAFLYQDQHSTPEVSCGSFVDDGRSVI